MLNLISRLIYRLTDAGYVCHGGRCPPSKKIVTPKDFPAAWPYSAGLLAGDMLYLSGQIGADFKNQKAPENFDDEMRQCLNNVGSILQAAGMDFSDVIAAQVYLTDIDLFPRMNAVDTQAFKEPRPLPPRWAKLAGVGAHVEIMVTARK
jgi:2-iminobutanoate/2-iminopropanoate deaminase